MSIQNKFDFMKTGKMYNDLDPEIVAYREKIVLKTNEYNQSFGQPRETREKILQEFMGSIGENVHFEPTFRCEFGANIHIGNDFYANFDCVMLDGGEITIGDNVLFGPRAGLYTSNHAINHEERKQGGCFSKPIRVGDNVWFGANVTVMPGVTIGDNTVIGAGSVVTSDIPSNVIAVGVPCKVLREITEADKTDYLLTLR
ncbi:MULTISPECIES: sugar O-acetyltransferase [unclassified Paenibacillus]|uniref:sugar O-acetyltransferase n=1 Tax=unclassified Paenibacillus TaxID=185978 RepID=UPI00031A4F9E|nr:MULTISPECIES: sugar O-acetyltransferase [unclassified Paenibacillus]MCM3340733.1 sugar O-acetyltransferase [Paenibacillus sp. MER TA 81-3]